MRSEKLTEENVNNRMLRKVRYFQDSNCEDMCLVGCEVSDKYVPKFRRNVLLTSSGWLQQVCLTDQYISTRLQVVTPQKNVTLITGNVSTLNYKEMFFILATARQRHRSILIY
jgi:hypothetical protein